MSNPYVVKLPISAISEPLDWFQAKIKQVIKVCNTWGGAARH